MEVYLLSKYIYNLHLYFKYLLYLYDVFHMKLMGSGVRQTINFGHIANSILIFPSIDEQKKISTHIDNECEKINNLVNTYEKQIEKFKEFKVSLINNVVTGKMKIMEELK